MKIGIQMTFGFLFRKYYLIFYKNVPGDNYTHEPFFKEVSMNLNGEIMRRINMRRIRRWF